MDTAERQAHRRDHQGAGDRALVSRCGGVSACATGAALAGARYGDHTCANRNTARYQPDTTWTFLARAPVVTFFTPIAAPVAICIATIATIAT